MNCVSRIVCTACFVGVLLAAGWAAPAPAADSGVLEYELQTTAGDKPAQKTRQKVWFKGARMRVETTSSKGQSVAIAGPEGLFLFKPGGREATKMSGAARPSGVAAALGFPTIAQIRQLKKVGAEKVGAYDTDIFEKSMAPNLPGAAQTGKFSIRYWVSRDLPVPVKVVTTAPTSQITQELKSAQLHSPIPDTTFRLPPGTKVRDITRPQK